MNRLHPLLLGTLAVVACAACTTPPQPQAAPAPVQPTPAAAAPAVPPARATAAVVAPTSVPAAPVAEAPVTLQGEGLQKTRPFALRGGNYTLAWEATAPNPAGCYHGGMLQAVNPAALAVAEPLANAMVQGTQRGETQVYRLAAGDYYLNMTSGCRWSVTISPLR